MRTVEEYLASVLSGIRVLDPIELPLASAHGCVLAEAVRAPWPLPSFDNAATDGFAVRADDIAPAREGSAVALRVIDDVPAGYRSTETVEPGTAVRVMTGAPIPAGADCVVAAELTDAGDDLADSVGVLASVAPGSGIRRAGEDITAGETALAAATLIGARQVAILAALGCGLVRVHPRPRIAVIAAGSELVEPGLDLRTGLVSESNSYLLVAAAREAGADAYRVGPVPDEPHALREAIEDQLHRADLIITIGGVSPGPHDSVRAVLDELGTMEFSSIAMNPGRLQGHGTVGPDSTPIMALPGNPVSSYVSFECFVRPVIHRMRGLAGEGLPLASATAGVDIASPAEQRQYVRARYVAPDVVVPVGAGQGAHLFAGLAQAEALVIVPQGTSRIHAGERVQVIDLR